MSDTIRYKINKTEEPAPIKDEYNIRALLESHGIHIPALLKDICEHLDKTLTIYIESADGIKSSANTETLYILMRALVECKNEKPEALQLRILEITEGYRKQLEKIT
ncbi:MAG: hypothetical protein HRT61_09865 [Ekhidna sp.]|nr:hypothetical protein [Ekhidna sp.]